MKRSRPDSMQAVTARFIKAMNTIVGEKIASGEKYAHSDFADSIGYSRTNIGKIINKERGVTLQLIIGIRRVYNINPNWLISGEGEMKLKTKKVEKKNHSLEQRVKNLELLIKKKAAR